MPDTHKILTELVEWIRSHAGHANMDFHAEATIANATKQIDQQQQERVEKLRKAAKNLIPYLTLTSDWNPNLLISLKAALKKLEAEGE